MTRKLLLNTICILFSLVAFAQEVTISGNIQDENKQPMFGANVVAKGTTIGTTTNEAGNYTLKVPKETTTLVVSYVGYANKEISVNTALGNQVVNVDMSAAETEMEQVVVSASKKKEKLLDAPASISVVSQEKLERNITTTPVEQLKTTTGVDVMRTGLVSSNVVIRGFNNIFSGTVLNVIDNRIGAVPSLRVNAYQLVPVSNYDYEKIEVVRGPASALYGPNASAGVVHIITKSPLDQKKKFETTIGMTGGFTVLDNKTKDFTGRTYADYNNGNVISGNIINPEIRHSGKLLNGKLGYKISGSFFQGKDYPNYDPREPYDRNSIADSLKPYGGDSLLFGYELNGQVFKPDTVGFNGDTPILDVRRFYKDFTIRKYTADARIDIKPTNDILITLNGGLAGARNVELTGLGAAIAGGSKGAWIYWYTQVRFKWKNLYVQYFINSSNAGNTFLIPQLSEAARQDYNSTAPPSPYQVRRLVDRSKLHVVQVQHSWNPLERLGFVYGVDVLYTQPDTKGTINGRFENKDNLLQAGGYLQGDYEPLKWLKLVAAFRVDYNSIIKNAAFSPRAAIVFKPAVGHNVRITYNRAFDSPNTLNQFLDLSNGLIPNGINVRGIGNPYGWEYKYDENSGTVQFKTAPWGNPSSAEWVTFNNPSQNAESFNKILGYFSKAFGAAAGTDSFTVRSVFDALFAGIQGDTGTVAQAKHVSIDYANFAQTGTFTPDDLAKFQNLKKINNSFTQTLEIGYKGLLFNKLSIQVDGYWTRMSNYVSALRSASGAVMLDWKSYLGGYDEATGTIDTNGILYKNLNNNPFLKNFFQSSLNGNPSFQNPNIVKPNDTTAWDELIVLLNQLPIGTITPNDPTYVGSDFILTYKNLGRLEVFGIDFGFQYAALEDARHSISAGGSLSWVDKDQFTLTTGENVPLNAPKVKTSITFDHGLKKSGFAYGLTFRYAMGYDAASSIYSGHVDPSYLLDARVSYRPNFYKGLLLSINVNNVANYQWVSFPGAARMGTQFFARAQVTF